MLEAKVLIAGGGPGGSSAAIALRRLGYSVILAERERFPRPHVGESLPPKISRLFTLLGVHEVIAGEGFSRMRGTTVHDGARTTTSDFDPEGRALGYQVDRARFDALLLSEAQRLGVTVLEETTVAEVLRSSEAGRVIGAELMSGGTKTTVACETLIDATGARGLLSRALRARHREDVRTLALTGYFRGVRDPKTFPAENTIFEIAPDGWIWSVLLADGRRNVTVGIDPSELKASGDSPEALYRAMVRRSVLVEPLLEGAALEGSLIATDATWAQSEPLAGDGFLLVGDSGAFVDPVTSHGVYKAIHAAIGAATAIHTAVTMPARRDDAFAWYDAHQRRTLARYAEGTLAFYRGSPHVRSPFWRVRARPDASTSDDDPDGSRRREAFLARARAPTAATVVLRARPGLSMESRLAPEGWLLVERPVLTRGGEQILAPEAELDLAALLPLLDGRPLERVFEAYVAKTGLPRSRALARRIIGALAELIRVDAATLE